MGVIGRAGQGRTVEGQDGGAAGPGGVRAV